MADSGTKFLINVDLSRGRGEVYLFKQFQNGHPLKGPLSPLKRRANVTKFTYTSHDM